MGKKDTLTKKYLSRPDIFADAFNYFLFDGKKVIKPKDLEEQDAGLTCVLLFKGFLKMEKQKEGLREKICL